MFSNIVWMHSLEPLDILKQLDKPFNVVADPYCVHSGVTCYCEEHTAFTSLRK